MLRLIQVFLSISLLVLFSCKNYRVVGEKVPNQESVFMNPFFNVIGGEYLYNAKINVFGSDMNGILVIKTIDENYKRMALLSDFGNTLFDFEFIKDEVKVKYIMEDLDKKIIVQKLKDYFQLLINEGYEVKSTFITDEGKTIVSTFQGNRIKISLDQVRQLTCLTQVSMAREKVSLKYFGIGSYPDSVKLNSNKLPITFDLYQR